jgi:hypothetical protein
MKPQIPSILAEIQTKHLTDKPVLHYRYIKLVNKRCYTQPWVSYEHGNEPSGFI